MPRIPTKHCRIFRKLLLKENNSKKWDMNSLPKYDLNLLFGCVLGMFQHSSCAAIFNCSFNFRKQENPDQYDMTGFKRRLQVLSYAAPATFFSNVFQRQRQTGVLGRHRRLRRHDVSRCRARIKTGLGTGFGTGFSLFLLTSIELL